MYLLYCDESNMEERSGDFLVYAGVVFDAARAAELSAAIEARRAAAGVERTFRLKFLPPPEGMSHEEFVALKQSIIQVAVDHGARLFVYVILHDIANDPDTARRNGINAVCFHFNGLLNHLGDSGLVLIDRFNDAGNQVEAHLRDKFSIGLTNMPYAGELRLNNIVGFHYCAIGQSHFPSLTDIVVGSLRFAINAHTRGVAEHRETAMRLVGLLSPMFHRHREGGPVSEWGFQFSPKIIRWERYRERYESLKAFLAEAGLETEQPITGERRY